jgi:hemerythrin-like domain-containing protein
MDMTTIIDQLETDHRNVAELLGILSAELDTIKRIEDPDYPLMGMVLDYLLTYPDLVHHPKEDLIYQMLLKRQPGLRETLDDLEVEHEVLGSLTREFADIVRDVVAGAPVERERFIDSGRTFVKTYRDHMLGENSGVFVLAREHLPPADLLLAAAEFHPQSDPLFGYTTEERFARLLGRIKLSASTTL